MNQNLVPTSRYSVDDPWGDSIMAVLFGIAVISCLQFVMQAITAVNSAQLRDLEESKVPVGSRSSDFTVGPKSLSISFDLPMISFSGISNGPGILRFKVNSGDKVEEESPVLPGQPFRADFTYPAIEEVYLYSDSIARGSLYAKVGKRF